MSQVTLASNKGAVSMATKRLQFDVEIPDELIADYDSQDAANAAARESFVMDLVRQGKISQGRAAKMLGVSRWDLPKLLAKHEIPAIMMSPEELEQDWQALKQALGKA
jgi:predicted HTH domain antitoxin